MTLEEAIMKDLEKFLRNSFSKEWRMSPGVTPRENFITLYLNNQDLDLYFRFHIDGTMIKEFAQDIVSVSDPNYKEKVKAYITSFVRSLPRAPGVR